MDAKQNENFSHKNKTSFETEQCTGRCLVLLPPLFAGLLSRFETYQIRIVEVGEQTNGKTEPNKKFQLANASIGFG